MDIERAAVRAFCDQHCDVVLVEVGLVKGSTPREAGAWMLVAASAILGTIGGGRLEYMAVARARAVLRDGAARDAVAIPLGPAIGQCCGGWVELRLDRLDAAGVAVLAARAAAAHDQRPLVYIFGAGHVGKALAAALALAPVRVVLVDSRAEDLAAVQITGIDCRLAAMPEALVRAAPPGSGFVVLTHDHGLDFLITAEALARGDASYVGMIGSATKRASFRSWLARELGEPVSLAQLVCPIGGNLVADKRPAVIAALTAAEVLTHVLRPVGDAVPLSREPFSNQALAPLGHEIDHQPHL